MLFLHHYPIFPDDSVLDLGCVAVVHLSLGFFGNRVFVLELYTPLEEQFQHRLHRVTAGFHDHEMSFGHGFQLVNGHKRTLDHLKLAVVAVASCCSGERTRENCLLSEVRGHGFRSLAVWSEGAEQGTLAVIHDDLRTFFAVGFLELRKRLDYRHNGYLSGTSRREHHFQALYLRQSPDFIHVEHNPLVELTALFVRDREHLAV